MKYFKSWIVTCILVVVIVAGLVFFIYHGLLQPRSPHVSSSSSTNNTQTLDVNGLPYSATIPGPLCDHGAGQWQKGNVHIDKNNKQVVTEADNATTLVCQSNGLLVTRTVNYDYYGMVHFLGTVLPGSATSLPFPRNYRVQVDAEIVSGDNQSAVDISVHEQSLPNFGSYDFNVDAQGKWTAFLANNQTGFDEKRLAIGFLKQPAKSYTLLVEVDGPVMSFSIDGVHLITVEDATYPSTDTVGFGVVDPDTKQPPSGLFSHFVYTELSASHHSAVTGSGSSILPASLSYEAAVPGFGCDKGPAQWEPSWIAGNGISLQCLSNGLRMTQKATKYTGTDGFYWKDGNFPANYSVMAKIDVSRLGQQGCAGFATRIASEEAGSYYFIICQQGDWQVIRYDQAGNAHVLASGTIAQKNTYTVQANSKGAQEILTLDGQQVASVTDKTLTTTDHIELVLSLPSGTSGSAIFSNFSFEPLL